VTPPLARLPVLEWSHRTAAGQHEGLDWVDATVEAHADAYRVVADEDGVVRFQHFPYAAFLPPAMLEETAAAQARGEATLQECILLLFARFEWLILSRELLWTSLSPVPRLLAALVQAYGVGPEVHDHHEETLARLTALLPDWFPSRGTLAAARRVLACAELDGAARGATTRDEAGATPPLLAGEVLACRSLSFWASRRVETARPDVTRPDPTRPVVTDYRIAGGVVLFQTRSPQFELRREDVVVPHEVGGRVSGELVRLLPPWTVLRTVLTAERSPGAGPPLSAAESA
jgi:hypothetical protein